jgi:hypothetical protein
MYMDEATIKAMKDMPPVTVWKRYRRGGLLKPKTKTVKDKKDNA